MGLETLQVHPIPGFEEARSVRPKRSAELILAPICLDVLTQNHPVFRIAEFELQLRQPP